MQTNGTHRGESRHKVLMTHMDGSTIYRRGEYRTVSSPQLLLQLTKKKMIAADGEDRPKNLVSAAQELGQDLLNRLRPKSQVAKKEPMPEPQMGLLEKVRTAQPAQPKPYNKPFGPDA